MIDNKVIVKLLKENIFSRFNPSCYNQR